MKQKLLDNIHKPIKTFKESGGIVGVCEKGGRFLGKVLKGIFDVTRFVVEPPVSVVILAGLITVDYLKKEEEKPLLLVGNNELIPNITTGKNIIDLAIEVEEKRLSKGAKQDIEQLLGLDKFDQSLFFSQYKKKLKEFHPDRQGGNEYLFKEVQQLAEEIRWTWFIDYKNLNEEDKQKYELMTNPAMRVKSYLYQPKYINGEQVGIIKIINIASCSDDVYYCRNLQTGEIVELTEQELMSYEI